MSRFSLKRLPSPALAVAFVALIAALSGTAIALPGKNTVDSGDIKKGAVKGKDIGKNAVSGSKVKGNSLTGSDIKGLSGSDVTDDSLGGGDVNEASLAKVPSAASADSAASAGNANAVDGQSIAKIFYKAEPVTGPTTVFSGGGLTIEASCAAGQEIAIVARSSKNDSSIYSYVTGDTGAAPEDPVQDDTEGGGFEAGDTFDLLVGEDGNVSYIEFEFESPDGSVASGTIQTNEAGDDASCEAVGHVIVG
jgi:hypothetical protein